jgi:hypothetical protein
MKNSRLMFLSLVCLFCGHVAHADPIHAVADGAYWHHDSGWVFPGKIGDFALVGIPQDVAGSNDAVAYYARVVDGARITASVDLYAPGSASADAAPADNLGKLSSEGTLPLDEAGVLAAMRILYARESGELTGVYLVTAGEWRVTIRIARSPAGTERAMDAFVLGQPWDTFTSVPIPR